MRIRRVLAVAALPVAALGVLAGCGGTSGNDQTQAATAGPGRATPPPWSSPANTSGAVRAAGLQMLDAEGTAQHIHAHLDVVVDGQPVTVPAGVGIDASAGRISPLHTHDTTGVLHVESPDAHATFTLGQFMTEWQVRLDRSCLGGLCTDDTHTLRAYVDGTRYTGDPASITLTAHQEIELVYGNSADQVTPIAGYDFAPGL
ncbi:MAG TPA: hypothetical protein VFX70_01400 [Mycobacteriales bacterium]|nr:hypothetical protein [Mycobacteriales bacterium]